MDALEEYIREKFNEPLAERCHAALAAEPDIYEEGRIAMENDGYPKEGAIAVEGYTAEDISRIAPFMGVLGTYRFLISLRNDPEWAKEQIKKGFPRK